MIIVLLRYQFTFLSIFIYHTDHKLIVILVQGSGLFNDGRHPVTSACTLLISALVVFDIS